MTAPAGAIVAITYDGRSELEPGHALVTTTGRMYVVVEARRQERGKHRGRWHLRCLVAGDELPEQTTVHPLRWYKRGRG